MAQVFGRVLEIRAARVLLLVTVDIELVLSLKVLLVLRRVLSTLVHGEVAVEERVVSNEQVLVAEVPFFQARTELGEAWEPGGAYLFELAVFLEFEFSAKSLLGFMS